MGQRSSFIRNPAILHNKTALDLLQAGLYYLSSILNTWHPCNAWNIFKKSRNHSKKYQNGMTNEVFLIPISLKIILLQILEDL